jgi:hypothetical protein
VRPYEERLRSSPEQTIRQFEDWGPIGVAPPIGPTPLTNDVHTVRCSDNILKIILSKKVTTTTFPICIRFLLY